MTVSIHITEKERLFCRWEAIVNPVIAVPNSAACLEERGPRLRSKTRTQYFMRIESWGMRNLLARGVMIAMLAGAPAEQSQAAPSAPPAPVVESAPTSTPGPAA